MIRFLLSYLWNDIFGWVGVGGVIIIGALAWAWFMPMFRRTALNVALIAAITLTVYSKGYHDAYVHQKAKWKAAELQARKLGDTARADALKSAVDGVRDPFDSDDN